MSILSYFCFSTRTLSLINPAFTELTMVLLEYRANSHVFKTVEGLELTLDAHSPEVTQDGGSQVALIHFHGGFFVSHNT